MRKGLFFSVPSVSVCKTLNPAVEELGRSGYHIVSYNTPQFRPRPQPGVTFKPYPTCYDTSGETRRMSYFTYAEMLLDTALGLRGFLQREMDAERPDFILHSQLALWGKAVAACYALPAVALSSTIVLDPRIMLPFYRKQKEEGSQVKGDVKQFIRFQRKHRTLYAELSGRCEKPDIWDAYINKEGLNIAFVLQAFQEQPDLFGSEYRFVGHPSTARPGRGERRLIYMSLGTILTDDVELLRMSVAAFGRLDRPCLISIGTRVNREALGPVPEHVRLAPFVDQDEVLGGAALFITMGGMASVHEAVAAEVPMIVIPETPEQHITSRRGEELGIARCLDRDHLTQGQLFDTIAHMLERHEGYRDNIRALKARSPSEAPATLARMHIDGYVNHQHTQPLSTHIDVMQ